MITKSIPRPSGTKSFVQTWYSATARQQEPALCCPVRYRSEYLKVIPKEISSLSNLARPFARRRPHVSIAAVPNTGTHGKRKAWRTM